MKEYSTKDIARITDIAESTVRKYAKLLEDNGYIFERNPSGYRVFTVRDLEVFTELRSISKKDQSVDIAAQIVADKYTTKHVNSEKDISDESQVSKDLQVDMAGAMAIKDDIAAIMGELENQKEFNKVLLERLDKQQKYIENRMNEHDRLLIENLRESQKQIAATTEKKWWQFWK